MPEQSHGSRRRRAILAAAADLSTSKGLDGLSFSRLADEVGLTKAGVAAHFESKEVLQIAVVDAAAIGYSAPLAVATQGSEPGLARLRALALAWLGHLETIEYRGGCFFVSAGLEFAGRPGPVRDKIAAYTRGFLEMLEEQSRLARRLGELAPDVRPDLLAFQVHSLAQEANLRRELLGVQDAFAQARRALADLLARNATSDKKAARESQRLASKTSPKRSKESR